MVSGLAPDRVHTQSAGWQIGDVFAGTGRERTLPGQYLVFNSQGQLKETLTDPFAGRNGTTTGCFVAPPVSGEALYTTSFFNLDITRFDGTAPHTATQPVTNINYPPVDAIESIVFDTAGNYYVGGLPPARESALDPVQPYGYIFKYSPTNVLLAAYEVPNGLRGADWIDLGSDEQTLYYTSEDTKIHVYKPGSTPTYREIVIKASGAPIAGTVYALRLLPPIPDNPATPQIENPNLEPSGFLVASSSGVKRLDADGNIIFSYDAPISAGSYFALNITPDGQSFWTATFQNDPDDRQAPYAGQLVKFHIATGTVTAGPINTGAPNVWGLCVKREYSAAANTCYVTNSFGQMIPDPLTGQPQTTPCRIPEICDNHDKDDDGDGFADADDPDCRVPGTPSWITVPNQTNYDGDTVSLQLQAVDPDGDPLTFSVAPGMLPPGLSMTPTGLITGTIPFGSSGPARPIIVSVSDGAHSVQTTFYWTILHRNGPPTLSNPGDLTLTLARPLVVPVSLSITDPDLDSVTVVSTAMPPGLTLSGLWIGVPTTDLTQIGPAPNYGLKISGTPTAEGDYPVTISIRDLGDANPPHDWVTQSFTIHVVVNNRAPKCDAASPSKSLWPPDHKFVDVTINGVVDEDGDHVTIAIDRILQDEPVEVASSGSTGQDGVISGSIAKVRAERSGRKALPGDGRVYQIVFTASDGKGGSCPGSVLVGIPHDQGKAVPGAPMPTDSGFRWDSLTGVRIY